MAEKKEVAKSTVNFEIIFPLAPKEKRSKQTIFYDVLSLIQDNKKRLNIDAKSNKKELRIILSSANFGIGIFFKKTILIKIGLADPKKNIKELYKIGDEILNFIKTVLGHGAIGSKIMSTIMIHDREKEFENLSKKIIGDKRLAEINNMVKLQLNPTGIIFDYKQNGRDFLIVMYSERNDVMITTRNTYKESIPFGALQSEYEELEKSEKVIIETLSNMEL